jgi:hypothetical protein
MAKHKLLAGFVGEAEIAEEFGRDRRTIKAWGDDFGLPYVKVGGQRLYNLEAVRAWVLVGRPKRRNTPTSIGQNASGRCDV